jgi:DNA repair protein RAD5
MLDPLWSFAVEAQAIDRIHRVGQKESVVVTRFIVQDSVEEKMLKIQDRKVSAPISFLFFGFWTDGG